MLEAGSDLERLVARTAEIAVRWKAVVVIDRGGPAASAIPALERAKVKVRLISLPDLVRACGDFHDAAVHARLVAPWRLPADRRRRRGVEAAGG